MRANQTLDARVYVGTYAKYNNGNINGAWISLNSCDSYEDFLKKCATIHQDEADPEYMIQDCENMPDGLDCGEWLSEKEFNDIKAEINEENKLNVQIIDYSDKAIAVIGDTKQIKQELKDAGGRFNPKLSCGPGWIFSKKSLEKVQKIIGGQLESSTDSNVYKKWLDEFCKSITDSRLCVKEHIGAVKLSNGWFFLLEKSKIENSFCFHDEGPQYEFYKTLVDDKEKMKEYFVFENLEGIENKIKQIQENKDDIIFVRHYQDRAICDVFVSYEYERFYGHSTAEKYIPTEEDTNNVINALIYQRDQFKKRLETYLKKYGTSKIKTWTYWADA